MHLPSGTTPSQIIALERAHVWPPYTSSERHERHDPLVVVEAEGPFLFDANGRRYIDAFSSWWCATLGHRHPRLIRALTEQASRLPHVSAGGITHAPVALLASELAAIAPSGLTRAHFSDDGSTAVEVAVKIAFQYWQQNGRARRHRFICLAGAYHGDTLGAASLASIEEFAGVFGPLLFDVVRAPDPEEPGGWEQVVEGIEHTLRERSDEIAGVIVEPLLQGASGMRMYGSDALRRIALAARTADTFLIADEVFTGYGRTGSMWACERAGVVPDLMCIAKGFTAGILPMGATLASARIYDGFRGGPQRALMHGHTFCGHPLGASVAREVLAIYRDERIVEGVAPRARLIEERFRNLGKMEGVRGIRTLGSIGAADLGHIGYGGSGIGWRVCDEARVRGVYLRPLGDTVYVAPPLNIPLDVLEHTLAVLEDSIRVALTDRRG
jgi:adenosylmethionine-8-amino-7-oxononanoate aminotransferase